MEVERIPAGATPARSNASPTRGILYVATGRRHTAEMIESARSVRREMPDVPVVAWTDQAELPAGLFDEVRRIERATHSFMDKIAPLRETPFDRTIFLDTDTYLCAAVGDLFDLLDRCELAVAHAPLRHDRPAPVPDCFCELNTGVVVYRNTPAVIELLADWERRYAAEVAATGYSGSDQPAFREALYGSSVSFYVLPSEYNLRTVMPAAVGRYRVRIIHGRARDMDGLALAVNSSHSIRVFVPDVLQLSTRNLRVLSAPGRVVGGLLDLLVRPAIAAERVLRAVKRRLLGLPNP